jgi:hypothetical protein
MVDTVLTPNMNIPVPVPSQAPGPAWASTIAAGQDVIDAHDHTAGKGVPITPDGLNVNADLPLNDNNLTSVRSTRYTAQGAPIAEASDLGCTYVVNDDLYYNDGSGNQVRITQGGSVSGSAGTITGLPSGTASASFSGGTFTFRASTNVPATMDVGPIRTGAATTSPYTVLLKASASQAANYDLTLPLALPGSTSFINVDSSGNMGSVASTGSGSVVLATSPTVVTPAFSGVPTGTVTGSTYTPTVTMTAGTLDFTQTFFYQRIGNVVVVYGTVVITLDAGGETIFNMTLPIDPTNNFAANSDVAGVLGNGRGSADVETNYVRALTSSKLARGTFSLTIASALQCTITASFSYSCA